MAKHPKTTARRVNCERQHPRRHAAMQALKKQDAPTGAIPKQQHSSVEKFTLLGMLAGDG
jgi:hypothetical protein